VPQLDSTFFPSQLFWLAISFALLFVLLKYWALPQVSETIEKRQKTIDDDLEHASKHQKDIELIAQKCDIILRKSRQEAHDLIQKKAEEFKMFNHDKEKELAEKLNAHLKNTEIKVQKAKQEAMGDIEKLITDLSLDLAQRLSGSNFSEDLVLKTVKENLQNHAQNNQGRA
jgi:F-type H+-transporting ATPase subunit b